jgi:ribosomal-protein-alanine N-acetyltransferase
MAEITIESMRNVHLPAVLEIEREAFTSPWTEEIFRQEVEDNVISGSYVALEGGRLVGYFVVWFLRQDVHLLNIAVVRSCRRRGIGRQMLRYLIDLAKRAHKEVITLEVRESNEGAIELYRSFGFTPVGLHREYYQDDKENALLMARSVSGWEERLGDADG